MKGVSSIVVSVLLVLVAVSIAGGFLAFGRNVSDSFRDQVEDDANRNIDILNSGIFISSVSYNSVKTSIEVRNIGSVDLDTSKFSLFIDGSLRSYDPIPSSILSSDQSVLLSLDGDFTCSEIKVTGQFDTSDVYPSNYTGTC